MHDIFTDKALSAHRAGTVVNDRGEEIPASNTYVPPTDPVFREDYLPISKKDFVRQFKCPLAYNPNNMSEHNVRPREVLEREVLE